MADLEALVEVARPGAESGWRVFGGGRRVAWKTGTSYGHRDAGAIGVTARYTVGVWAGSAEGEGRPGLTGTGAAAPVLFDIVNRLEGDTWFPRPEAHLKEVKVCRSDGYRAAGGCETAVAWAPRDSHFERPSPHHRTVHLDRATGLRVHGRCESAQAISHETWFVLPPGQESFYRRWNTGYRPLPAYRGDCAGTAAVAAARGPVDFLYPDNGTRIYIPVELGGRKGRAVTPWRRNHSRCTPTTRKPSTTRSPRRAPVSRATENGTLPGIENGTLRTGPCGGSVATGAGAGRGW